MKRFLALILVLVCSFAVVSCGDNGDVPAGMKLASNTDIVAYKLFVPESWLVTLNDTRTAVQVSDKDVTNLNVAQWNYTGSYEDWWEKEYKPSVFEMGAYTEITVIEEGNEILLDKKPAKKYVYTAKFGDSFFKYEVIACIHQGSIHIIHITYMQDKVAEGQDITYSRQEANKDTIQLVLDNFRFN